MSNNTASSSDLAKRIALAIARTAALAALIVVAVLNAPCAHAQSAADRPKFEVASVKPCNPGGAGGRGASGAGRGSSPNRLDLNCQTVANLIQHAYGGRSSVLLSGGPAWINSERYRIDAKAEAPLGQEVMGGPMLQALLEDRFQLRIHRESKEVPVYEMTVAKGALKLQRTTEGACESDPARIHAARAAGEKLPAPCGIFFGRKQDAPGWVTASTHGMSLREFADNLSHLLDRPVIDKTGIVGSFDLHAEFVLDESTPGLLARELFAAPDGTPPDPGPSIIAALWQQLGLELKPARAPGEFLVIDNVERPSEN